MLHGRLSPIRVKVKSHKEVGHLTKCGWSSYKMWLVILQSKSVILQGTLVGHLKLYMLKTSKNFNGAHQCIFC